MSSTPPSGSTPAGWYPDTNQPGTLRYWDGNQWTEHTHRQEVAPPPGGPGQPPPMYQAQTYQAQTYQPGMSSPPDNQLVPAILTTLFCCLPFGIVSIVKAAQVNSQWNSGQYDAARQSAADAKKWWRVSAIVGVVVVVLYFLFAVVLGTTTTTTEFNNF